jgi:hypothetical protein
MDEKRFITTEEYEAEAMGKIRYHHALWIACGRDREKVRAALAQADAEHDYRPAARVDALQAELMAAEDELTFAERASLLYRIPDRLVAAHRRVEAARTAMNSTIDGVRGKDGEPLSQQSLMTALPQHPEKL